MRGGVGVVPAGEVAVVGRDDGVLLSLLHVLPEEGGTQTGSARWLSGHCYTQLEATSNTIGSCYQEPISMSLT